VDLSAQAHRSTEAPESYSDRRSPAGTSTLADAQLRREIGPWSLTINAVNNTIGGGIFALPGVIAALLGPAAVVGYLLCGVAMTLALTCFAEIGSFVRRSGGPIAYIDEAFGPFAGFLAWVLYCIGCESGANAAIANVLVSTVALLLPALAHGVPRILALAALFAYLTAINIRGLKHAIYVSVATTVAKLVPLALLILAGLFAMHPHNLRWTGLPSAANLGEASLLLFFTFQGAEEALCPSAEIRDPARTVPRGIFAAMGVLVVLYAALQAVSQGVLGSALPASTATPLADVAARIAGQPGRLLLLVCAGIAIFGSIGTSCISAPRSYFRMAQDGMLPHVLTRVHPRYRTPYVSVVVFGVVTFLLAVSGAFRHLAVLSSASLLCIYLAICCASLWLRYTREPEPGAFRAPGGPTVGILGSACVVWMLCYITRREFIAMGVALAIGTAYYLLRKWVPLQPSPTADSPAQT
jgi:amino acid transporter